MSSQQKSNTCAEPALTRARRTFRSVLGAMRTHYPGFLLGLPLPRGTLPVFVYHDVDPLLFAGDLEFLRRNRYRTLSLEEFASAAAGKSHGMGRGVLLTFDDARRNFHETALPILKEFNARATLFAPTYWMSVAGGTADGERFMSWEQLRAAAATGLIDVQSHAHRHALVFTSGRLLDFANPRTLARYDIYDWPMRNTSRGEELGRPSLGAPIYAATPLLSASRRFVEDAEVAAACIEQVARGGADDFFTRPDWSATLRRLHGARGKAPGRFADEAALRALVASEFELSRELFVRHLGYSPQYLAYPWMMGSPQSLQLAPRFGLRGVFGVALDYGRARATLPVSAYGRLKADWLRLLPGSGRSSFFSIAANKVMGIARTQHLAH